MGATNNNASDPVTEPTQKEAVKTGIEQVKAVASNAANSTVNGTAGSDDTTESTAEDKAKTQKTFDADYIKKLEAEHEAALNKAVEEAVKKAGMTEEEKAAYAKEQKEIELEQREKELFRKELKAETKSLLAEQKLPASIADMVMGDDIEATKKNMAAFKETFDAAVQAQVEARLVGKTPVSGSGAGAALTEKALLEAEIDKYLD